MSKHFSSVLASFVALTVWASLAQASSEAEVIYGDDDRRDLFESEVSSTMFLTAQSTAALLKRTDLTIANGTCHLPAKTFGDDMGLCAEEPFREQPSPAFCSGFLVGPDVFVTAGHCIISDVSCAETALVFGFGYSTRTQDVTTLAESDVYFCSAIISRAVDPLTKTDYAVVRLDRPVQGRQPLAFRKEGRLETGANVTVIGHPSGLPTKVSGGAKVRSSDEAAYFVANLDTYGGNSGSAVVNDQGEVEGILVRGERDFVGRGNCLISNRCLDDACRGEDVTRATEFAPFVPPQE